MDIVQLVIIVLLLILVLALGFYVYKLNHDAKVAAMVADISSVDNVRGPNGFGSRLYVLVNDPNARRDDYRRFHSLVMTKTHPHDPRLRSFWKHAVTRFPALAHDRPRTA